MGEHTKIEQRKHTPEPWIQNVLMIVAPNGGRSMYGGLEVAHTGLVGCNKSGEQAEADASRIVECVNACAGMDHPAKQIAELQAEVERLNRSIADIRDAVLHERYQLAEAGLQSDQVNCVLGIIDDHWQSESSDG
jgi:hypothetical protein